jgi:hypothetical protein
MLKEVMTEAARAGTRTAVMLSSFAVRDNGAQPYSIGAQHKALTGRPATTFADWAAGHAASFR